MDAAPYRSFSRSLMMQLSREPSAEISNSRPHQSSTLESRRSSAAGDGSQTFWESGNNSSGGKFWESGGGGGDSGTFFRSVSSSLLGSRHVDAVAGPASNKKWTPTTCRPRRFKEAEAPQRNASPQTQPDSKQWTVSERAQRVAQDKHLKELLLVEVEKAGVVTAAGYRAVHQKFLYSKAVEEALVLRAQSTRRAPGRTRMPRRRSGRLGSLVASFASIGNNMASQVQVNSGATAAQAELQARGQGRVKGAFSKKTSSGSGGTSSKKSDSRGAAAPGSNLAPRRVSQAHLTQSQRGTLRREVRELWDQEQEDLLVDSFAAGLGRSEGGDLDRRPDDDGSELCEQGDHDDSSLSSRDSQGPGEERSAVNLRTRDRSLGRSALICSFRRRGSDQSLDLGDIFDGTEGSNLFASMLSHNADDGDKKFPVEKKPSSNILTAPISTLSRLDTLSANNFDEVDFDPDTSRPREEDEEENIVHRSSSYSIDTSGWLPWPQREQESDDDDYDYDDDSNDVNNNGNAGELLVSFQSLYLGADDSFSPWPTEPDADIPNNKRARAA